MRGVFLLCASDRAYKRKNNICKSSSSLRNYQREALSSWIGAKMSGCVVLLTGAGKTMIGLGAIYTWIILSMVVVSTIDLIRQWTNKLSKVYKHINIDTVTTYESAYLPTDLLQCRERT